MKKVHFLASNLYEQCLSHADASKLEGITLWPSLPPAHWIFLFAIVSHKVRLRHSIPWQDVHIYDQGKLHKTLLCLDGQQKVGYWVPIAEVQDLLQLFSYLVIWSQTFSLVCQSCELAVRYRSYPDLGLFQTYISSLYPLLIFFSLHERQR